MQQLRSYQAKSKKLVESAWSGGARAPILILPTGSGKTTIVAHLVREFPSRRVLFLCPWRELVYQAHRRFVEHGIPAGISMGCLSPKSDAPVHISTIQTASRRNLGRYDLVVIDEAHRAVSKSCLKIVKQYPRSKILGITATGRRHDGKPLSKAFDRMLIGATVAELTRSGHFAPYECYGPREPIDTTPVKVSWRTKDYHPRGLEKIYLKPRLIGDAVQAWTEFAPSRPTFIYCVTLRHVADVVDRFNSAGIPAAAITGETGPRARRDLFEKLESGDLRCLVNVGVLTEGVDFPSLGAIAMLRPTLSGTLFRQIIGRGSRLVDGKSKCVLIDHAGNINRHGFPTDEPTWTLTGRKSSNLGRLDRSQKDVHQCPFCQHLHPRAEICPKCGYQGLPITKPGKLVILRPNTTRYKKTAFF